MNSINKKMLFFGVLSCLLLGGLPKTVFGQLLPGETLPVLQDATINASIQLSTDGIFAYSYSITNLPANTGKIESLEIDISKSSSSIILSFDGLTNDQSFPPASLLTFNQNAAFIVPVGFRSPAGWDSGFSVRLTASWGASDPQGDGSFLIQPGGTLNGFVLLSRGIPGIRSMILHPEFVRTPVDDASANDVARVRSIEDTIKFTTVTVGPVAPTSLNPRSLLNSLIALKHQSVFLGWISSLGSDGIVNSLDAKLSAAKASITSGDNKTAVNQLNAFINELDAQHGKSINDNAYYLLKPNAQFIISKLGP